MAVLHEAQRVLETGGTLTLVTLCETQSWQCGDETFACLHTTAESLRVCAAKAGFHVEFFGRTAGNNRSRSCTGL